HLQLPPNSTSLPLRPQNHGQNLQAPPHPSTPRPSGEIREIRNPGAHPRRSHQTLLRIEPNRESRRRLLQDPQLQTLQSVLITSLEKTPQTNPIIGRISSVRFDPRHSYLQHLHKRIVQAKEDGRWDHDGGINAAIGMQA
ncbi:hypothetical protein LINGRAHAP2_LOCUS27450, partial [Linum grandiflorum]